MSPSNSTGWRASWRYLLTCGFLFGIWTSTATAQSASQPAATPTDTEPSLAERLQPLVHSYFKSESAGERAKIVTEIEALDGVTVESVALAVRSVNLWDHQHGGFQRFSLATELARETEVCVHLPDAYDPARAYPLLLAYHGMNGRGETYLRFTLKLLGSRAGKFIVAAPTDYHGVWFASGQAESREPPALIEALKRRYHVDTDRIYVSGYSMGGGATFAMSLLYTDWLAGSVPLAGTFAPQVATELVEVMLPNVRNLPMLVVYGERDRMGGWGGGGIAVANRALGRIAERLDLPVQMVELKDVGHLGVIPPADAFGVILDHRRPHDIKHFDHWFRYPSQGRMGWVRQTQHLGEPWRAQRLVVRPAIGKSRSDATIATLKNKLPYIGGRIDGQTIRIETRKCEEIDLLLHDGLIDLDREITVYLNGKKRLQGAARRKVSTLLDAAYRDWDFQRLWPVRFSIPRKARARQD